MFPQKKPHRFFALGVVLALSLASISVTLALIASAQGGQESAFDAKTPGQVAVVQAEPAVAVAGNGDTFRVYITVHDADNLGGFQFVIDYDPAIVEATKQPNPMVLGPFPGSTGRSPTELTNEIDPATGVITYVVFTTGGSAGPDGDGVLAFVDLQARALGETALDLKDVELTDIGGNPQDASGGDGLVIVASPPNLAEVSILKSADPATVTAQGLLTYTLQRTFSRAGQHAYNEIAFDPLPDDVTYLADSATLNGLPAPGLYSATLNAIHYRHSGVFTDSDQWTIAFQVRAASVHSGTLISNAVTETASFDGAAYSGPYVSVSVVTVTQVCTGVNGVDLTLLTGGDIYTDTLVAFSADISPADASKPYSYTLDYDDGTAQLALSSSDDPLTFTHTFVTTGSHDVEIAVWNCAMTEPEAAIGTEPVTVLAPPEDFWIYLSAVMKKH